MPGPRGTPPGLRQPGRSPRPPPARPCVPGTPGRVIPAGGGCGSILLWSGRSGARPSRGPGGVGTPRTPPNGDFPSVHTGPAGQSPQPPACPQPGRAQLPPRLVTRFRQKNGTKKERGWEEGCSVPSALGSPGVKRRGGLFFYSLSCSVPVPRCLWAFPPKNKMEKSVVFLCHLVHFLLIIVGRTKKKKVNQGQFKYIYIYICIIANF